MKHFISTYLCCDVPAAQIIFVSSNAVVFLLRYLFHAPPNMKVWHEAFFFCGSGRRAGTHMRPTFPQNAYSPLNISLIRGASRARQYLPPPQGGKSLEGLRPEAVGNLQLPRHTRPDPYCSQHGRPKCYPTTGVAQCYYSCHSCCDCGFSLATTSFFLRKISRFLIILRKTTIGEWSFNFFGILQSDSPQSLDTTI